jgi:transposase
MPCRRLAGVPGIGPVAATTLAAAATDGSAHARARDLPAWLGLAPQQRSTGGKTRLGGISRRGNSDLRKRLIVGTRTPTAARDAPGASRITDPMGVRQRQGWIGCPPLDPEGEPP